MCGIALVLSGGRLLVVPSAAAGPSNTRSSAEGKGVSVDELKEALWRRGPDNLGCERLRLCADGTILGGDGCNGEGEEKGGVVDGCCAEFFFIGATLHLRGRSRLCSHWWPPLEVFLCITMDSKIMWFGRDAFGRRGLLVHWPTADDSRFILSSVAPPSSSRNHSASTVYGLVLDPDMSDYTKASYWEELPCGVYSIHLKGFGKKWHMYEGCIVKVRKHEWTDSSLNKLIQWERKSTTPVENNSIDEGNHHLSQSFINTRDAEDNTNSEAAGRNLPSYFSLCAANCITQSAYRVLVALWESVMLRTSVNTLFQVSIQMVA